MKRLFSYLFAVSAVMWLYPQQTFAEHYDKSAPINPVKNVILMISDGTSLPTVSLARWYQRYKNPERKNLHLDPYLCGTLHTYCSNAPIGDSAPTTSCYMMGMPSIAGFVATYPYSDGKDDLVPVDTTWSYRPITTLMEATRILQGKRTGIVVTSHITDATPSDCLAHSYNRAKGEWLMPQLVHSGADILMGGSIKLMTPDFEKYLKDAGYGVYVDDKAGMESHQGNKMFCLFGEGFVPYDIDRDPAQTPSLAEMTREAIKRLDNEKGFMLMVEGSKVDWGAHANDPVAATTEMIAFDEAIGVALDFAKKDGNTVVIVTSDHGNSGLSIGRYDLPKYAEASKDDLFANLTAIRKTSVGLAKLIKDTPYAEVARVFKEQTGIELNEEELEALKNVKGYTQSPIEETHKKVASVWGTIYTNSLDGYIASIFRKHTYIGFTTHGHTAEEVYLAISAPEQTPRLTGFNTNIELHNYMRSLLGIREDMLTLSDRYFAPHDRVFEGCKVSITGDKPEEKVLTVRKGRKKLVIPAFSNQVTFGKKSITTPCASVYVDKKDKFYVSADLADLLK